MQCDLETVSSESGGEGPVLLSDQTDYRGFPNEYEYKKKNQSYLTDYFGSHVSVETREYIPT